MSRHLGVMVVERAAAIVSVERDEMGDMVVIDIERLPADISAAAARLESLPDDTHVTVDHEGLGTALWAVLGRPDWRLYTGRGIERQHLVDGLLVAMHGDQIHFAAGLAEQEAMNKALTSYRRTVGADGAIGGELVVALLLALLAPPEPTPEPQFAWR